MLDSWFLLSPPSNITYPSLSKTIHSWSLALSFPFLSMAMFNSTGCRIRSIPLFHSWRYCRTFCGAMEPQNTHSRRFSSHEEETLNGDKEIGVSVDVVSPGKELRFTLHSRTPDFCTFVESFPKQSVVSFFRQVIHHVEVSRKILDFHLRVKNKAHTDTGFAIDIFYGDEYGGPYDLAHGVPCISCHGDAPLYPYGDVLAGECVLREFSDQPYVQCCVDAKARPGFIVTPLRHVERMSELDDEEMYYLWWVGVRALRTTPGFSCNFTRMVLNHGCYRNVAHLHLKIWVDPESHARAREMWPPSRRMLWTRLENLASLLPTWRAQLDNS